VATWRITVTVRGPGGTIDVEPESPTVEAETLNEALRTVAELGQFPAGLIETVGLKIEKED